MDASRPLLLALLLAPVATAQSHEHHVLSVGDLVDGDGPTHLVWTPDGAELLVLHHRSENVTILDGDTLQVLAVVPIGAEPADLEVTPDGQLALVANAADRTLTVIDLATRAASAVALAGLEPHSVVPSHDSAFAVVASYGDATSPSSAEVVDLAALQVTSGFPAPDQAAYGAGSYGYRDHPGLALTPDDQMLLVPAGGELRGYDVQTGVQVGVFVPDEAPYQRPIVARVDSTGAHAAVLCGDLFDLGYYEVIVVDLATWTGTAAGIWLQDQGAKSSRSFALTPDGTRAIVAGENLHLVDVPGSGTITLPGAGGEAVAVTSDGATVVVAPEAWQQPVVRAYDVASASPTGAVLRGRTPRTLAARPVDGRLAALLPYDDEDVVLLDGQGGGLALLAQAPTGPGREGDGPTAVAVDPTGTFAITANERSDNLTVLDLRRPAAVAWIPVHDRPMDVRLVDAGRTAVVWHADGDVSFVDVATRTTRTRLPTGVPGVGPHWGHPTPARMAPIDDARLLLSRAPYVATLTVSPGAESVAGRHEVPQGVEGGQPPTVSAAGVTAFPQVSPDRLELVDVAGPTGLYSLTSVEGPRCLVPTDGGELLVAGEEELQRFDVQGAPQDLGTVVVGFARRLRVDEAAGFAYLAVGHDYFPPGRLVVVDVAAMQVVAELDLPDLAVDLELALPHAFVALRDGSLLRFRADGANTTLLSSHPTRGVPLDLVVGEDGRTVLLVKRDTDEVDVFAF